MSDVIKSLKAYIASRGTSQASAAEELGVSFQTVNRWLNGKVRPSRIQANKIISFLRRKKFASEHLPTPASEPMGDVSDFNGPIQRKIHESLKLLGDGPASYYRDACKILAHQKTPQKLESASLLIGHMLREVESSMREALLLLGATKPSDAKHPNFKEVIKLLGLSEKDDKTRRISEILKDTRKDQIREVLKIINIAEDSKEAQWWLDANLSKHAHRKRGSKPRPIDQEFIDYWNAMERILFVLSERLSANYSIYIRQIDEILSATRPTKADIEKFKRIPSSFPILKYFFEQLQGQSPIWAELVLNAGFFHHPPKPEYDPEKKSTYYISWPASRYLAQVSASKVVDPEMILKIIRSIPKTDNPRVHHDLLECALHLPPKMGVEVLRDLKHWLSGPFDLLAIPKTCRMIEQLLRARMVDEALGLVKIVFKTKVETYDGGKGLRKYTEIKAILDGWHYQQELKKLIPTLAQYSGVEALAVLADMYDQALSLECDPSIAPTDHSYVWCSNLNEYKDSHDNIKSILALSIRELAKSVLEVGGSARAVVSIFDKYKWNVFERLTLNILCLQPEKNLDAISKKLMNKKLFEAYWATHEYWTLVAAAYHLLDKEQQDLLLSWIDQGPSYLKGDDKARDIWKKDRLGWIASKLPVDRKEQYKELEKKYGLPSSSEIISVTSMEWGPKSPLSPEELGGMSIPALISYLKNWEEPKGSWGEDQEGLSSSLTDVISKTPEKYLTQFEQFKELEPIYVRSLIEGCQQAVKSKKALNWPEIVSLCRWVVEQKIGRTEDNLRKPGFQKDVDWSWARRSIISLIEAGFQEPPVGAPITLRERIWEILEILTNDPDPDGKDERMEPLTLSLNTVRGQAIHAAVRYGLWVRRNCEKSGDVASLAKGFDAMPELRRVLEGRLELRKESSLAIRAIYGQWLPWLVLFDANWVTSKVGEIFPKSKKEEKFGKVVWGTYLKYGQPYESVFDAIKDEYVDAVRGLDPSDDITDIQKGLVEHLIVFAYRGKINLDAPDSLMKRFWSGASLELKTHAIESLGRTLYNSKGSVPERIVDRFKALWEERLKFAIRSGGEDLDVLSSFGWWFASKKLDDAWSLDQLTALLHAGGSAEPGTLVIERLLELVDANPRRVLEALGLLIQSSDDEWLVVGAGDNIQKILDQASSKEENKRSCEEVISHLVAKGHLNFKLKK